HGRERTAMEGALEGYDLVGSVAMQGAVLAGEFDRTLVGLGPTICEEYLVKPAKVGQLGRKLNGNVIIVSWARCDQLPRLPSDGVSDGSRRMAEAVDRPALHEVQISFAIVVP